jgi:hypothetical protein
MFQQHSSCNSGFVSQFCNLFGPILGEFEDVQDPRRGAPPTLLAWELLASLVYHVFAGAGCLSAHVFQLFGMEIKDSSLSQRRQRMGLEPFEWLMSQALRPLADRRTHKDSFYKGLRLCGIDGSRWSVTNTPQILEKMSKAAARRCKAAFAKIEMNVLVELGMHNPVAAAVSLKGEGEWSLAAKLLGNLPKRSLLIVDRLYGCGAYLKKLMDACQAAESELLVKARGNIKSHKAEKLSDGSALISINLRQQGGGHRVIGELRVREIRGRIKKPGSRKWNEVRLWTTLLDEKIHPAEELLKLYAVRWEQEIFYKELKLHLRGGDVLQSHTPETAAQEVAALLMACSILARERSEAARSGKLQPLSISFLKTREKISSLWEVLQASHDLLDEETMHQMVERIRELIVREAIPPRRQRSCPRKVRKPVGSWPRLTKNESNEGDFTFEIVNFP